MVNEPFWYWQRTSADLEVLFLERRMFDCLQLPRSTILPERVFETRDSYQLAVNRTNTVSHFNPSTCGDLCARPYHLVSVMWLRVRAKCWAGTTSGPHHNSPAGCVININVCLGATRDSMNVRRYTGGTDYCCIKVRGRGVVLLFAPS